MSEEKEVIHLTTEELATRWRMSVSGLAAWRVQGKGPRYLKLGDGRHAQILYPLSEVKTFERMRFKQSTVSQ